MPPKLENDSNEECSLTDVLDSIAGATEGGRLSMNDVLRVFSDRSLGVMLTALGLLASMPVIGAVPGVSVIVAICVLVAVGQSVSGRGHLRLPGALGRRSISSETAEKAIDRSRPWTRWVDSYLSRRLTILTEGRTERIVISIAACLLAISMIPLAVVPWGVTPPALGITAFGLALIARDGLLAAFGYLLSAVTLYLILAFV